MSLYTKFCAWLSGWPEGSAEGKKKKKDDELFREEASKPQIKPKKVKGLNPKKKRQKARTARSSTKR